MSTTIDVIPVDTIDITFGQVLTKATERINERLKAIGTDEKIELRVNVHHNSERYVREVTVDDLFDWTEDEYAWFAIVGVPGGTDAHVGPLNRQDIDPRDPWWFTKVVAEHNKAISDIESRLERAKRLNKLIYFRRSAGQPGIIALSYGIIAAAVAELTNGILWSDDGAWDIAELPATCGDFYRSYFVPRESVDPGKSEWAQRCIDGISADLRSRSTDRKAR